MTLSCFLGNIHFSNVTIIHLKELAMTMNHMHCECQKIRNFVDDLRYIREMCNGDELVIIYEFRASTSGWVSFHANCIYK